MEKRMINMLGGVSVLALLGTGVAVAAPIIPELQPVRPAQSFAELLDPIPNAMSVLQRDDARMTNETDGLLQLAQYDGYGDGGGYSHHHHHHHFRRYYRQEYVPFRGYYPRQHHHHHHHHWHHQYYGD